MIDWLFSYVTLALVVSLLVIFFSPLAGVRIGGENAQPLLKKWHWFSITLCTTVATGILFWASAEPIYHLHLPPESLNIAASSEQALEFSMATLFMHWSFSPYAIYTVPALTFSLCYYNMNYRFSIGSLLRPVLGNWVYSRGASYIDAIALFALVAGMSASLGTGILILSGGIESELGIKNGKLLMGLVTFAIVASFVMSAVSGLHKGMAKLSSFNTQIFIGLCLFVLILGPASFIFSLGFEGLIAYVKTFIPRSLNTLTDTQDGWAHSWTIFYFANWYAWAPVTALFLGRIARGYTVRQFIVMNFVLPSVCIIFWLSVFSGATLHEDINTDGGFFAALSSSGPEALVFMLFDSLPFALLTSIILIVITFLSFVTAADSNTDAMSRLCQKGGLEAKQSEEKASTAMKFIWGIAIGLVAWIMVSYASIDGIKMMSNLGGLPALFIILISNVSLFVLAWRLRPKSSL